MRLCLKKRWFASLALAASVATLATAGHAQEPEPGDTVNIGFLARSPAPMRAGACRG